MKRKILVWVLLCALIVSVFPMSVFAEDHVHEDYMCPGEGETHTTENCSSEPLNTVAPSQCGELGYTLYECKKCANKFIGNVNQLEGEHEFVETSPAIDATCGTDGKTAVSTCEKCGATTGGEVIEATGKHEWALDGGIIGDCNNGRENTFECKICGDTKTEPAGTGHVWNEKNLEITKAPTCSAEGKAVIKCEYCEATEEVTIPATGAHTLEEVEGVEADCENAGVVAHWHCSVCGKNFANENDKEALKTIVIPALGHNSEGAKIIDEKAATCTEAGYKKFVCTVCGKEAQEDFPKSHLLEEITKEATCTSDGYTVEYCTVCGFSTTTTIPAKKHTALDKKNATKREPTHSKAGAYIWTCEKCNEELSEAIPALGHTYGIGRVASNCTIPGYTFTYCTKAGCDLELKTTFETFDVSVNGKAVHFIEMGETALPLNPNNHVMDEIIIKYATCTEDGLKKDYCTLCDDADDIEPEVIPALGKEPENGWYETLEDALAAHKNLTNETEYREGNCLLVGLYGYECSDCGKNVYVRMDKTGEGHVLPDEYDEDKGEFPAKKPTCTEKGYTAAYTCTSCGTFVKSVEVPATGHKEAVDKAVDPTCSKTGLTEGKHCSVCNVVLVAQEVVEKLPHKEVTDKAVAATCTEAGKTAGKHCSVCKAVTVAQITVPALGHNSSVVTRYAGCTNDGISFWFCDRCDDEVVVSYTPVLGHNIVVDEAVDATCESTGRTEGSHCDRCDYEVLGEIIPALPHKNAAEENFVDDCEDTVEDRFCTVCEKEIGKSHDFTETVVEPTCTEDGYTLQVCKCGESKVTNYVATRGHDWRLVAIYESATYTKEGKGHYVCDRCLEEKDDIIARIPGIQYSMTVENANGIEGSAITDSSLIKVTVSLKGSDVAVQGIKFNLKYSSDAFKFVKAEFVSENFNVLTYANDNGNNVGVTAFTGNDADGNVIYHNVNEAEAVVVLYFRVDFIYGETMGALGERFLSFDRCEAVGNEEKINVSSNGTYVYINKFLDANADGDVTLVDVQSIINMITGASETSYNAVVDINKDGVVNINDAKALCEYITGAQDYDDLKELGAPDLVEKDLEELGEVVAE